MSIERIYCTDCDCDMEYFGKALDCPVNGSFYICPICKHRIVVFEKENKKKLESILF